LTGLHQSSYAKEEGAGDDYAGRAACDGCPTPAGLLARDRGLTMKIEKPSKRMTLREHITHAEKCTRDLVEHANGVLLANVGEFRDLTRPVRRLLH
jgi:hypothetical protein